MATSSLGPGQAQPPQQTAGSGQAITSATPGALPGIEKFDKSVTPLTVICGADVYQVRYSSIAQQRLGPALTSRPGPPQTATIDKVDIRVRCHSEGVGGMSSRCYADTALGLTVSEKASGAGRRSLEAAGRSSEGIVFACGSGTQAIEQSMDNALGRMVDRIAAGN